MIGYEVDSEGIATLAWDMPGRSMNVLNADSLAAFEKAVDQALADEHVSGVVVASAKRDFIAGADLEVLLRLPDAQAAMDLCEGMKALLRKMETGGKPFVAAINGTALGGGYELALGCHARIAADEPRAQIGLPEVTLGLLPGGGGTQRLPRMIGLEAALPLLLEGTRLDPRAALDKGLVDEVVAPDSLMLAARQWIREKGNASKTWYDRRYVPPGPAAQSPQWYAFFTPLNAQIHARTRGNQPAPRAILSCVYEGMQVPFDAGLRIESRWFANLAMGSEARNMIRTLFFSVGSARRLEARPKDVPAAKYSRIGVLGAGMMGSGIACVAARAGLEVVLLDRSAELAEKGKAYTARAIDRDVKRGRASEAERDETLARITATTDYADLKGCGIVVEAVFEDRGVKAETTRKAAAVLAPGTIIASNTSTLPITGLAEAAPDPARFIGLHFFSPVDRMALVEVIRGRQTSDETLAQALDLVKRLGKTPILVNDSRGFYTSRVFARYIDEGMAMLAEGVAPALIENAGRLAGFPVGPLAVTDEVSQELVWSIRRQQMADEGDSYQAHPGDAVLRLFVETLGRKGRKAGAGFYDYPEGAEKRLWPDLGRHFAPAADQPDAEEVKRRLSYVQAVDAARCLEEGVLADPRDGDVGSVLGWGFPAHLGGAVSLIDTVGAERFVAECDRLAQAHGPRFAPPQSLRDMAARRAAFHAW